MLTGFLVIAVAAALAVLLWLPYWLFSELLGLSGRVQRVT